MWQNVNTLCKQTIVGDDCTALEYQTSGFTIPNIMGVGLLRLNSSSRTYRQVVLKDPAMSKSPAPMALDETCWFHLSRGDGRGLGLGLIGSKLVTQNMMRSIQYLWLISWWSVDALLWRVSKSGNKTGCASVGLEHLLKTSTLKIWSTPAWLALCNQI